VQAQNWSRFSKSAIEEFEIALKLNPNFARARQQLEAAQALKDR
jgi:hypothetical protein